ncbi:hypothetical protein [Kangiella marina]|uniref:Lipocalin-like domain-containing protein n=1 Tax=Kangiella marina TaxID=1079178 RepID=A0ABP8IBK8_9GAMM
MKILALLLIAINLTSCSSETTYPDYKNKIIGKWSINYPGVPYYYGQAEYKENGEVVGWGKAVFPDGTVKETLFHDSWEIEGNKITFKPLKMYRHEAMNKVITDTIIDINDKEMILLNPDGEKLIRTRIKD